MQASRLFISTLAAVGIAGLAGFAVAQSTTTVPATTEATTAPPATTAPANTAPATTSDAERMDRERMDRGRMERERMDRERMNAPAASTANRDASGNLAAQADRN